MISTSCTEGGMPVERIYAAISDLIMHGIMEEKEI
jgi:hypothetical protein